MSDPTQIWQDLVSAALVGTQRQALTLPAAPGRLGTLLAQLDPAADAPLALLRAAALTAPYLAAGNLPAHLPNTLTLPPCPPETQPVCSPAAAARLATLVAGNESRLITEWLELAAQAGRLAPARLLPALLDAAESGSRADMFSLLPVLGQRGRWLCRLFGAPWTRMRIVIDAQAAAGDPAAAEALWQTGSRLARAWLLRFVRAADPAAALALLRATWSEDRAEERSEFLGILLDGLSMADEPFLESALDDRSKEVRQVAVSLLVQLPASHLVARQFARAQQYLKFRPPAFLRKAAIEVTLPESCDAAMQRDGVPLKAGRGKQAGGEKANWLAQMLAAVPPGEWCRLWGQPPATLLEAAKGDWYELLSDAWANATVACADPDWCETLLEAGVGDTAALAAVIPAARREAFFSPRLRKWSHGLPQLLVALPGGWSAAFTRLALDALNADLKITHPESSVTEGYLIAMLVPKYHLPTAAPMLRAWRAQLNPVSDWNAHLITALTKLDTYTRTMEELQS